METIRKQSNRRQCLNGKQSRWWTLNRPSFSLIELLVVIAIIGVLAGLITQAVTSAIPAAREASIMAEIQGLSAALKQYNSQYGEYPPDFSDAAQVRRHCKKRWPRINPANLTAIGSLTLTRAQALVFWLRGFGPDPQSPYLNPVTAAPYTFTDTGRGVSDFDFDKGRLIDPATSLPPAASFPGVPVYMAAYGNSPLIYFNAKTYTVATNYYITGSTGPSVRFPYLADQPPTPATFTYPNPQLATYYMNPDSFQILSAGLDGAFTGIPTTTAMEDRQQFPSGKNYGPTDYDNLTNFSTRNMQDSIPP